MFSYSIYYRSGNTYCNPPPQFGSQIKGCHINIYLNIIIGFWSASFESPCPYFCSRNDTHNAHKNKQMQSNNVARTMHDGSLLCGEHEAPPPEAPFEKHIIDFTVAVPCSLVSGRFLRALMSEGHRHGFLIQREMNPTR